MERKPFAILLVLIAFGCATGTPDAMSQESLANNIEQIVGNAKILPNVVEFHYEGVAIASGEAQNSDARMLAVTGERGPARFNEMLCKRLIHPRPIRSRLQHFSTSGHREIRGYK